MALAGGLTADVCARVAAALPEAPLVVALSGGADSAALAGCVVSASRPARAVTIDHGLAASPDLVAAAREIASMLGLAHTVVRVDAASGEGPLRDLRLAALEAEAHAGEIIITGHTADDQAETVLGNLLRGAGGAGLSGIPAHRGMWARPMLGVTRSEARSVAAELGLPFVDDPDNTDPSIRRSRLRVEVLPYLETVEGERVRPSLVRAGRLIAADDRLIEQRAALADIRVRGPFARTSRAVIATTPGPVASRIVRRLLRAVLAPYAGTESDVDAVVDVVRSGRSATISSDLLVSRDGPWVVIGPDVTQERPARAVDVGSAVDCGWWTIGAYRRERPEQATRWASDIRPDVDHLEVRTARPGDRIDTEIGSKPVVDVLREAGIGSRFRSEWPVVEADGTMAWVVGCRTATWARPSGGGEVVRLTAREAPWTSARS